MKNLLFLILLLTIIACQATIEKKEQYCSQTEKNGYNINPDSFLVGHKYFNKLAKINDFDTIYRFEGHGGWGEMDYLCTIYKQLDSAVYKIQLTNQRKTPDRVSIFSEKTLSIDEWKYIQKKVEESNFWCYNYLNPDIGCIDCTIISITVKYKETTRTIRWSLGKGEEYNFLRGLGVDILELADYPMPKIIVYYRKMKDSVAIDMIPSDFNSNTIKRFEFKNGFKGGEINDGIYHLKIHKKDFEKVNDIEMVVEFFNGKIRTTTEKEFRE